LSHRQDGVRLHCQVTDRRSLHFGRSHRGAERLVWTYAAVGTAKTAAFKAGTFLIS